VAAGGDLRAWGLRIAEAKAGGLASPAELKAGGFGAAELKAGGFGAAELKAGGFGAAELKAGGFGVAVLKASGFDAAELRADGFGAAELRECGFSAAELVATGGDLRAWGLPIAEAKAGLMPPELFAAGFTTLAAYKGLGFTFGQLCSTGRPDGKPFSSRDVAVAHASSFVAYKEAYASDLSTWSSDWALQYL